MACAVRGCGMDRQRLTFPNVAVAIRKLLALCQQSARNVGAAKAQRRDLNCCGAEDKMLKSTAITYMLLRKQLEEQEEKCGSCGVGIFLVQLDIEEIIQVHCMP